LGTSSDITNRGNTYLRKMFAHGTREPLGRVKCDTGGFDQWVHSLAARARATK